jgi:hypothetical protein
MELVAATATRVNRNTDPAVNRRIAEATRAKLAEVGSHPPRVRARLAELDREWDIERAIEANAAALALTGVVLGVTVHRGFLALPFAVTTLLLTHAVQGWCPPVPLLRRAGFRTHREIEDERHVLLRRLERRDPARRAGSRSGARAAASRPSEEPRSRASRRRAAGAASAPAPAGRPGSARAGGAFHQTRSRKRAKHARTVATASEPSANTVSASRTTPAAR